MAKSILYACRRWSEHHVVLGLMMSATLTASFYRGYGFSNNSYAIASWLVTYESGFIKRGLLGTLLQLEMLSVWTGFTVPELFFAITNTMLVLLHGLVFLVLMRWVQRDVRIIIFLPYFLSGLLLRVQSVWIGNIDHFLAILMLAIVFCLIQRKVMTAVIIAIIGIFVHEIAFAMIFPVLAFFALLENSRRGSHSTGFYQAITGLVMCTISIILIIAHQELLMSGSKTASYIDALIARQPEDNYNRGAISEVYATSFYQWFTTQKNYFIERITDPALFWVVIMPAIAMLALHYRRSGKSVSSGLLYASAFLLAIMPLAVLSIAWDIDRIWNLSVWTLFLILWLLVEDRPCLERPTLGMTVGMFVLSIPAFLMPQVRGNLEWQLCFLIYIPMLLWQIVYLLGTLSAFRMGLSR